MYITNSAREYGDVVYLKLVPALPDSWDGGGGVDAHLDRSGRGLSLVLHACFSLVRWGSKRRAGFRCPLHSSSEGRMTLSAHRRGFPPSGQVNRKVISCLLLCDVAIALVPILAALAPQQRRIVGHCRSKWKYPFLQDGYRHYLGYS